MAKTIRRTVCVHGYETLQDVIDEINSYGEIDFSKVSVTGWDGEIEFTFVSGETDNERKARLELDRKRKEREKKKKEELQKKELELFLQLKAKYEPADTDSP